MSEPNIKVLEKSINAMEGLIAQNERYEELTNMLNSKCSELERKIKTLRSAVDLVLNCGEWYKSALEIDTYEGDALDGEEIEKMLKRVLELSKLAC